MDQDSLEKLRLLKAARDEGLLTEEEHNDQKRAFLEQLLKSSAPAPAGFDNKGGDDQVPSHDAAKPAAVDPRKPKPSGGGIAKGTKGTTATISTAKVSEETSSGQQQQAAYVGF